MHTNDNQQGWGWTQTTSPFGDIAELKDLKDLKWRGAAQKLLGSNDEAYKAFSQQALVECTVAHTHVFELFLHMHVRVDVNM